MRAQLEGDNNKSMVRGAALWPLLWWRVCVLLAASVVSSEDAPAGGSKGEQGCSMRQPSEMLMEGFAQPNDLSGSLGSRDCANRRGPDHTNLENPRRSASGMLRRRNLSAPTLGPESWFLFWDSGIHVPSLLQLEKQKWKFLQIMILQVREKNN